jgi:hypothetical protein
VTRIRRRQLYMIFRGDGKTAHPYDLLFGRPKTRSGASPVPIPEQGGTMFFQ